MAQSINFPQIPTIDYGAAYQLNATASSGLQVTYKSLTPAVCYILYPAAGPAVQYVSPVGTSSVCNIEASQAGDAKYAAAPVVTRMFMFRKAPMVLTPYYIDTVNSTVLRGVGTVSYASGTTYNFISTLLYLSGNNSGLLSIGGDVSAESVTPTVCTVEKYAVQDRTGGLVTWASVKMLAKSTCTVRWTYAGTAQRASTTRDMTLNVSK